MSATDSTAAVEAVFRIEFPRVVAALARACGGDLGLAEDLAQDSLVDALRQWPSEGTPRNPGAWLTAVGKRKAIDRFRRDRVLAAKYAEVGRALEAGASRVGVGAGAGAGGGVGAGGGDFDGAFDEEIEDDRLRLIFVACHPVLAVRARVALTLRLVGGLTVPEIARAYLDPEATVAQRIVRAKKTIARAGVPFEVPVGEDRAARLGAVLEVVYLIYNEGYSATSGEDWLRPELCAEALRLGRGLAALAPDEAEVHGLVALMEFQSSRLRARTASSGAPVLLFDQDRRSWDALHINRGEAALARAESLASPRGRGPYALQAAIASCHARSFGPSDTDWARLVALYSELAQTVASPVVELNRAVAISYASGPEAALPYVDMLVATGALARYHLLFSVRADLLDRLRRFGEAAEEWTVAAGLATNEAERSLLSSRAEASRARAADGGPPGSGPGPRDSVM
ncbi:MAG TPA: RNA polymerase sigma factor [Acidimicrobiales bacterium]|nr:RNA polymerase sigma factor [Acidimicrobiales bacterium]